MKKHLFYAGMAALALTCGLLVMGCDSPLQEGGTVHIIGEQGPAVDAVNAVLTTSAVSGFSAKGIIVSWDAVEGATEYYVYYQQEGKKTIKSTTGYGSDGQNDYTFSTVNGTTTANADVDKWSTLLNPGPTSSGGLGLTSSKGYRFGVVAQGLNGSSGIVWSDYVTSP